MSLDRCCVGSKKKVISLFWVDKRGIYMRLN